MRRWAIYGGHGKPDFTVSLPTVANSLETSIIAISWAVIAYQISQISLSLVFGRVGDIYGRHTLFGVGLVVSSYRRIDVRPVPERNPADCVSFLSRCRRFHDPISGARISHGIRAQGFIGQERRGI